MSNEKRKSREQKGLEKRLNKELYGRCKESIATDGFQYDFHVNAYIKFYELMLPPEQHEPKDG